MENIVTDKYCDRLVMGDGWIVGNLAKDLPEKTVMGESLQLGCLCGRFDGLLTCIKAVDEHNNEYGCHTRYDSSEKNSGRDDWTIYNDYATAVRAFKFSPEVFNNFKESDAVIKDWESVGNDVEYSTSGDFLDIGRYMEGDPEPFGIMRNGTVNNKFCRIVVNGAMSCGVSKDTVNAKAKRIARLVDMLEHNHIRCQVEIYECDQCAHVELIIKKYEDVLNINDLCVALSADFTRRILFRFKERSETCEWGYGTVNLWSTKTAFKTFGEGNDVDNVIIIDGLVGNPMQFIDKAFNKLEEKISISFERGDKYVIRFENFDGKLVHKRSK